MDVSRVTCVKPARYGGVLTFKMGKGRDRTNSVSPHSTSEHFFTSVATRIIRKSRHDDIVTAMR
eukprot:scaffold7133_cov116-Cylindrotheca_fusiformis.AAC.4